MYVNNDLTIGGNIVANSTSSSHSFNNISCNEFTLDGAATINGNLDVLGTFTYTHAIVDVFNAGSNIDISGESETTIGRILQSGTGSILECYQDDYTTPIITVDSSGVNIPNTDIGAQKVT